MSCKLIPRVEAVGMTPKRVRSRWQLEGNSGRIIECVKYFDSSFDVLLLYQAGTFESNQSC